MQPYVAYTTYITFYVYKGIGSNVRNKFIYKGCVQKEKKEVKPDIFLLQLPHAKT